MTRFIKEMHKVNPECILIYIGEDYGGNCLNIPARTEIPENINEQLIVDIYSK